MALPFRSTADLAGKKTVQLNMLIGKIEDLYNVGEHVLEPKSILNEYPIRILLQYYYGPTRTATDSRLC